MPEKLEPVPEFDLESAPIDWSEIEAEPEGPGRWGFLVPDRVTGRKIAWELAKILQIRLRADSSLLEDIKLDDCRIDGNQLSFMEEGNRVTIQLRHSKENPGYLQDVIEAMNQLIEKMK